MLTNDNPPQVCPQGVSTRFPGEFPDPQVPSFEDRNICFGMLTSMSAQSITGVKQAPVTNIHLILDNEWQLVSSNHPEFRAVLDQRGRELLELFHREGISIDILGLMAERDCVNDDSIQLWITIYGPPEMAKGVGTALQQAELYLQDPTFSLADVEYFNPQRFTNTEGIRTVDFRTVHPSRNEVVSNEEETLVVMDLLHDVTSTTMRHETSGSRYLQTELQRSKA
ncbi:hypothetical protein CCUS01_08256 [Colletotrichum cuscutae]|uniref:Uncharacterized protein n=1 Tax=Colletotrichum cuscutae TaxID=1209917 RepID=A0AAI9UUD7_9PEZI|nr:hypothetical protein CCUS01_08256 [Colletotrichum cuscutae]